MFIHVSEQKPAVVLRTERLVLRPFRLEDVDDFFEYARDPDWARYLALPQPYTRSDAEEFVARQVLKTREGHGEFAIELEERGSRQRRLDHRRPATDRLPTLLTGKETVGPRDWRWRPQVRWFAGGSRRMGSQRCGPARMKGTGGP